MSVCVCVRERERERERVTPCVAGRHKALSMLLSESKPFLALDRSKRMHRHTHAHKSFRTILFRLYPTYN